MTPSKQKELQEKAALWDSLGEWLKDKFAEKFPYSETIQNTSNASSFVELLEEESKEMCGIHSVDMTGKCFKCVKLEEKVDSIKKTLKK